MGDANVLHPNVVIGDEPQDLAYSGGPRRVRIGARNVFREGVTVHRGSERGDITIIGDDNFLMQNAHVAHDCRVGNGAIIAGGALLAGWVEVGDRALVSGNCVVHQYVQDRAARDDARDEPHQPRYSAVLHRRPDSHAARDKRRGAEARRYRRARRSPRCATPSRRCSASGAISSLRSKSLTAAGPMTPEVAEMVEFIRAARRGVAFGPRAAGDAGESRRRGGIGVSIAALPAPIATASRTPRYDPTARATYRRSRDAAGRRTAPLPSPRARVRSPDASSARRCAGGARR